jgi:hypothetical protein
MGGGPAAQNAVSAEGSVSLKRQPSAIRVTVPLSVKGKTTEEALAKLKERREAASAKVVKLKADKKNVKFSDPSVASVQTDRRHQMNIMIQQRITQSGKKPKGLQVPESVALSCCMTAEWPVSGKTPEEIFLEMQSLKQKIKAAELSGKKEDEKLSPEEEEVAAEMEQQAVMQGENPEAENEPQYLFVAHITPEEREKAMADAFAKAKKNAESLAKSAGVELGPLLGLSGTGNGAKNIGDDSYGVYSSSAYQRLQRMQQLATDPDEENNETVAADASALEFTFSASALFKIGNADKK